MSEAKRKSNPQCRTCVKAAGWDSKGRVRCRVLLEPPKRETCWAFSDDPQFWSRIESEVAAYAALKEACRQCG